MSRKIISLFTLFAFIVFSISCYITRVKKVRTVAEKKGGILSLVKTSGEYIKFSKNSLGRIYGDKITGTAVVLSKEVEIIRNNIKEVKRDKKGMMSEITHKNGKIYHVVTGTARVVSTKDDLIGKEEEIIIFFTTYETYESISIPLSEVKSVKVKNFDIVVSLLAVGAVIGLGVLALGVGLSNMMEIFEL